MIELFAVGLSYALVAGAAHKPDACGADMNCKSRIRSKKTRCGRPGSRGSSTRRLSFGKRFKKQERLPHRECLFEPAELARSLTQVRDGTVDFDVWLQGCTNT